MNVTKCLSWFVCVIIMIVGNVCCTARDEPKWPGTPMAIDLATYGEYEPRPEFSTDGRMVCAFWEETYQHGDATIGPPLRVVFNVADGKIVEEAVDAKGRLAAAYIPRFPGSVPRLSSFVYYPLNESLKASTPFPSFLHDAGSWGFNSDFSLAIRLAKPRSAWNGRPHTHLYEDNGYALWAAELWQLSPKKQRLWTIDLPKHTADLNDVLFFRRDGKDLIALALYPGEGYILSQEDGKVVAPLPYNSLAGESAPVNTVPGDATGPFEARCFSFDPRHNWLACGAFTGKGVRVLSLDGANKPVFEVNIYDNPYLPKGGVWTVRRVEFAADGKYLIVDRSFAGRGILKHVDATDIYETKTWQIVWKKDSDRIHWVCLSPDGRNMAYVRSDGRSKYVLEIGPFVETVRNATGERKQQ